MYPRLTHIGHIVIPTFGAAFALGLVLALLLSLRCARLARMHEDAVWNLSIFICAATLVLSRLVLIASSPAMFLRFPLLVLSLPTLTRFGPLLAAGAAAAWIYGKRMPWRSTLDALAAPALLLLTFLHLGHFFAGDDLGTGTTLAIGRLVPGDEGHHPVALYAAIGCAAITVICYMALRSRRALPGTSFGIAVALLAAQRFTADEFRPLYLLPHTRLDSALRLDQWALLAAVVAGGALLMQGKGGTRA